MTENPLPSKLTVAPLWTLVLALGSSLTLMPSLTNPIQAQPTVVTTSPTSAILPASMNVYLLGPGDSIKVSVLGFEEYNAVGPQVVLPDGTISLPLVERFVVSGKTVAQVQQELKQRLGKYLIEPTVEVQLISLRPLTVTVSGEVRRPGPLQLQALPTTPSPSSGSDTSRTRIFPTVSQAIGAAGGVTKEANIQDVTLVRQGINGQSETITLNLWNAVQSDTAGQDLLLRDGDSIFIPKAVALDQSQQRLLARSAFASPTVRVKVIGEVKRPGELELPPDQTLASAIAIAGGPTDKANLGRVRFYRLQPNGTVEEKTLNMSKLTEPTQVEDGDVVMVPKSDGYRFLDTFSAILSPISGSLVFFRLFQ